VAAMEKNLLTSKLRKELFEESPYFPEVYTKRICFKIGLETKSAYILSTKVRKKSNGVWNVIHVAEAWEYKIPKLPASMTLPDLGYLYERFIKSCYYMQILSNGPLEETDSIQVDEVERLKEKLFAGLKL
jgi:hypothetical protein